MILAESINIRVIYYVSKLKLKAMNRHFLKWEIISNNNTLHLANNFRHKQLKLKINENF